MPKLTLSRLRALSRVVKLSPLAEAAGLRPGTIRCKLSLGGPELTPAQSEAMLSVLARVGLSYTPPKG